MEKEFDELTIADDKQCTSCTLLSYEFSFENSLLLSSPAIRGRSWKMISCAKILTAQLFFKNETLERRRVLRVEP